MAPQWDINSLPYNMAAFPQPPGPPFRALSATRAPRSMALIPGVSTKDRTMFTAIALLCMVSLALALGFRIHSVKRIKPSFAQILVHLQTFLCISFVISSSILVSGLGLTTQKQCYSSILICLVYYTTAKMSLYIFLLERAHVVRAPFLKGRLHDWVWIIGMLFIVLGFGALSIACYITPHAEMSPEDGRCRIGTSAVTSYMLLAFDIFTNGAMTLIFVILLRPTLNFCRTPFIVSRSSRASLNRFQRGMMKVSSLGISERESMNASFLYSIKATLWKNVIGSGLITLASAANLTAFYIDKATQLGWVCLITCLADVTWGTLVVHWLTIGGSAKLLTRPQLKDQSNSKSCRNSHCLHRPPNNSISDETIYATPQPLLKVPTSIK